MMFFFVVILVYFVRSACVPFTLCHSATKNASVPIFSDHNPNFEKDPSAPPLFSKLLYIGSVHPNVNEMYVGSSYTMVMAQRKDPNNNEPVCDDSILQRTDKIHKVEKQRSNNVHQITNHG